MPVRKVGIAVGTEGVHGHLRMGFGGRSNNNFCWAVEERLRLASWKPQVESSCCHEVKVVVFLKEGRVMLNGGWVEVGRHSNVRSRKLDGGHGR